MAISFNGSLMMRLIMVGTSCINSLCKNPRSESVCFLFRVDSGDLVHPEHIFQKAWAGTCYFAQMKISSARMISSALSLMLFILPTHSIWSCAFILSFTPSLRCI